MSPRSLRFAAVKKEPQCGQCNKSQAHRPLHAVTCKKGLEGFTTDRHHEVVRALASFFRKIGFRTSEEYWIHRHGEARSQHRIDIRLLRAGREFWADVTVVSAAHHADIDASHQHAEKRKDRKYQQLAREQAAELHTVSFNDFGGWSEQARAFIDKMRFSAARGPEAGKLFARLRAEISCAIIRGNGKAILSHCAEARRRQEKQAAAAAAEEERRAAAAADDRRVDG